jgi:hypothetical protein
MTIRFGVIDHSEDAVQVVCGTVLAGMKNFGKRLT